MFSDNEYVNVFTDMMSEGFIVIDNEGKIQVYNKKAKEIFGIIYNQHISHERGSIKKGDIVIIGDNSLSRDDGNLTYSSLKCIGIEDKGIDTGDALIAVGVYDVCGVKPVYLYKKKDKHQETLKFKTNFIDMNISVVIDFTNKIITIEIDGEKYTMNYINAVGHIVILDGKTKKMKFYQSPGYTARRESINDILKGEIYRAKGENFEILNIIGKDIFEIHKGSSTIKEFLEVAKGKDLSYSDEFKEINGIPTMCTLLPVDKNGKRIGAALIVEDISEIKRVIKERDEALQSLEEAEKKLLEGKSRQKYFPEIISESKEMEYVKNLAIKASRTNSTVLIMGESGTGKTLLAKAIHDNSKNKNNPFVHVNCGVIAESLLETELFGYEGGAFTGAKNEGKKGFFEIAEGGTIFLDEIGEIPLSLQVKLLQFLQDKSFYRVGGTRKIKIETRIIAATNKNLEEEMLRGRFREDLYYRINVFPIYIPPLRERKNDIYPLVNSMLPNICKRIGSEDKRMSGEAFNMLLKYQWPGNVRELENILERAINLSEGSTILSKNLTINIKEQDNFNGDRIVPLRDIVKYYEKKSIENALKYFNGDKKKAMNALDVSKTTFYEKLRKYSIN